MGAVTSVHNELAEVGGSFEGDRGEFGKEVLSRGIRGEDVETSPKDPFQIEGGLFLFIYLFCD